MNHDTTPHSPIIPDAVFQAYGARCVTHGKGVIVFHEGETSMMFHSIQSGRIKMVNYSEQGREFVQGYFSSGQSFGEPPFFNRAPYPSTAVAVEETRIWKCPHADFLRLLRDNFDIHLALTQALSGRLLYKSMMLAEIASQEAEHRLRTLLAHLAREAGGADPDYLVPLTRQQLADMTGLRVETVIRTIKALEMDGLLSIDEHGKVHWHRRP